MDLPWAETPFHVVLDCVRNHPRINELFELETEAGLIMYAEGIFFDYLPTEIDSYKVFYQAKQAAKA